MATAHDATAFASLQGGVKYPEGQGRFGVVHFHINWADLVAELAVAINPAGPDSLDIWDIPIGTQITGCFINVVTAATTTATAGTATMGIGDATTSTGADINELGYLAQTDIKTVAKTGMIVTDAYGAATKVYAVASMLRLTFAGTATVLLTGIVDIFLFCHFADIPAAEPSAWT